MEYECSENGKCRQTRVESDRSFQSSCGKTGIIATNSCSLLKNHTTTIMLLEIRMHSTSPLSTLLSYSVASTTSYYSTTFSINTYISTISSTSTTNYNITTILITTFTTTTIQRSLNSSS